MNQCSKAFPPMRAIGPQMGLTGPPMGPGFAPVELVAWATPTAKFLNFHTYISALVSWVYPKGICMLCVLFQNKTPCQLNWCHLPLENGNGQALQHGCSQDERPRPGRSLRKTKGP